MSATAPKVSGPRIRATTTLCANASLIATVRPMPRIETFFSTGRSFMDARALRSPLP